MDAVILCALMFLCITKFVFLACLALVHKRDAMWQEEWGDSCQSLLLVVAALLHVCSRRHGTNWCDRVVLLPHGADESAYSDLQSWVLVFFEREIRSSDEDCCEMKRNSRKPSSVWRDDMRLN